MLDVTMTNKPELFRTANVYDPGISDHAWVYGIMREKTIYHSSRVITVRNHKSIDEVMLLQDISSAPWRVGEIFDSIDDQYFYWSALLNDVLQEHIPLRKKRVRSRDVPYMTDQWKDAIRKKRKYSKMFAKNPIDENLQLKRKWRNVATKLRRRSLKQYMYWKSKTEEMNHNPREFYPFLDSKTQDVDDSTIILGNCSSDIKDQTMVADCFVEYFTGIAQGVGDSELLTLTEEQLHDTKSIQDIRNSMRIVNGPKFSFSKVSQTEVQSALVNLNVNKSYGHDGLSNKVLKLVGDALAPSLTKIFNICIDEN